MAELPQELISEILPQLPVKSLKRCRCISKSLCEVIDSRQFVDSHLSKFSQNSKNLRNLIFQDPSKKKFHVCDVDFDEGDDIITLGKPVISSPWKLAYGSCKGLILLYRGKFKFALWNPSTKESRNLPDCPLKADNQIYTLIGSGLSYDDSINDFKAFCIVHIERKNIEFKHDLVEVWIYQLKSNSWRKSQNWDFAHLVFMNLMADHVLPGIGCFIPTDGIIHWVCTTWGYIPEIVAFDVRKETYSVLPLPDCSLNWKRLNISTALHVLDGCLCVSYLSSSPLEAHLFIRKKDGSAWTQLFSVTEPLFTDKIWFQCLNVLGYAKGGNKIVLDLGVDCLVSYDLTEKSFAKVEIDKDPNWKCPIPYLESLVSVGGGA